MKPRKRCQKDNMRVGNEAALFSLFGDGSPDGLWWPRRGVLASAASLLFGRVPPPMKMDCASAPPSSRPLPAPLSSATVSSDKGNDQGWRSGVCLRGNRPRSADFSPQERALARGRPCGLKSALRPGSWPLGGSARNRPLSPNRAEACAGSDPELETTDRPANPGLSNRQP